MPTIIGLFDERAEAMRAYDALLNGVSQRRSGHPHQR